MITPDDLMSMKHDVERMQKRSWIGRAVFGRRGAVYLKRLLRDAASRIVHLNRTEMALVSQKETLEERVRGLQHQLEAEREKAERIRIAFLAACEAIQHAESTADSFCDECGREKGTDGNCPSCPPF